MSKPYQSIVSNYTILAHREGELSRSVSFQNRTGTSRLFATEDFTIIDTTFNASADAAIWQHHNDRPVVESNFVLAGQLFQSHSGLLKRQLYAPGYYNCLFSPGSIEKNELIKGKAVHGISLQADPDYMIRLILNYAPELEPFARKIADRHPFICQSPALDMPVQIRSLLKNLWFGPMQAGIKKLYFESVALQLLSFQFEQLMFNRQDADTIPMRSAEIEKLYNARTIVLEHLHNPPSLSKLANACQLNEFSLKKGFKQLFGTTVFAFILQQRMETARIALHNGDKTISELAYELGYTHPQHFHRVFKKYYGITPKRMGC